MGEGGGEIQVDNLIPGLLTANQSLILGRGNTSLDEINSVSDSNLEFVK